MNQTKPFPPILTIRDKHEILYKLVHLHDHSNYLRLSSAFYIICKNKKINMENETIKDMETIILDLILDFNRK